MLRNCTLSVEFMLLRWCPGQGSNLHDGITRRGILSPLCLPVSPPGLKAGIVSERNWERGPFGGVTIKRGGPVQLGGVPGVPALQCASQLRGTTHIRVTQ